MRRPSSGLRCIVFALTLAGSTFSGVAADPLSPIPTTGTATGTYRTGLAKAGLVSVEALDSAHVWVARTSLDGDDDAGKRFDVRVELLSNGAVVASGVQRCVGPLDLAPTEVTVPWSSFTPPAVTNGDVLALRVSTRIGTNPNDSACKFKGQASGVRVFYNSASSASRFGAQITPSPSVALYLRSSALLHEDAPNAGPASTEDSGAVAWKGGNAWKTIGTWSLAAQADCANEFIPEVRENPPAPEPETITVTQLPLPPAAPSNAVGACNATVNPNGTGCMSGGLTGDAFPLLSGGFIDNNTVVASILYAGAPAAPDPASIFSGRHLTLIKVDGTTFASGDPWKCITCGMPPGNRQGATLGGNYAQPYLDNTQNPPIPSIQWESSIVQCSGFAFTDEANCTAANTFAYPIRWNQQGNGGGAGGSIREVRINPDGIHLGFSRLEFYTFCAACGPQIPFRAIGEFSYFGRLSFNPAPTAGTPLVPRFDLLNVTRLYNPAVDQQSFYPDPANPGELLFNPFTGGMGEFRAFSGDGTEIIGIVAPAESDNTDVQAVDLATGTVRRVTRNPEYIDPIEFSRDGWAAAMDTRGTGRQLFMAAMGGIPAINDLITSAAVSSVRNNGQRRFFQEILIDPFGDRGDYQGQVINAAGDGGPNAINDPNYNGIADPWWSPDGTKIVYGQKLVTPPDCGTVPEDVPCPTYDNDGRRVRLMLATLEDRAPLNLPPVPPVPDAVPWGTPFTPGSGDCVIGANQTCPQPNRTLAPAGTWTLRGQVHGQATVNITTSTNPNVVSHVNAAYTNYSDDGINVINGTESADRDPASTASNSRTLWHQNLTLSGCQEGTKLTSEPDGFQLTIDIFQNKFNATGTLETTIDGTTYTQPANGT